MWGGRESREHEKAYVRLTAAQLFKVCVCRVPCAMCRAADDVPCAPARLLVLSVRAAVRSRHDPGLTRDGPVAAMAHENRA